MAKKLHPVHPGEVLLEDYLKPLNLTPYALAQVLEVPVRASNGSSGGNSGHRGYGPAAGSLLRHNARFLDGACRRSMMSKLRKMRRRYR